MSVTLADCSSLSSLSPLSPCVKSASVYFHTLIRPLLSLLALTLVTPFRSGLLIGWGPRVLIIFGYCAPLLILKYGSAAVGCHMLRVQICVRKCAKLK